jgi:hypothetical protein
MHFRNLGQVTFKTKPMKTIRPLLTRLAIAGNLLFVLWILYNGMNEHFEGTLLEKISYFSLMALLLVNSLLLGPKIKG